MINLNAFTQCSICPQSKGQWKHPLDRSSIGYRDLDYYAEMARTLERGRFDALFFADIHGTTTRFAALATRRSSTPCSFRATTRPCSSRRSRW
jgi:alkanesulfonate monooxygenase SsuD/methylene tetrahydromethanopterin reductase-like flavin-dependent oxidoreductase (luciferase family)